MKRIFVLVITILIFTRHGIAQEGDSLKSQNHFYYLADVDLRISARLILTDSIEPSDNFITFASMDSISANQKEVRDYYFPVFQKIVGKSDGALSEVVGAYLLAYIKKFPKEFSDRYHHCAQEQTCNDEIQKLAFFAGYEIIMQNDYMKWYQDFQNVLTKKYKNWKSDKVFVLFTKSIDEFIEKEAPAK
jgi:hypothetical protein